MGKSYTRELEHYLRANPNTDFTGRQLADAVGCYATDPDGRRRYPNAGAPLRVIAEGCAPNASYPKGREPMENLGYVREGKSWLSATFRLRASVPAPVITPTDRAEYVQLVGDMAEIIVNVNKALTRIEAQLEALEKAWT